MTTQVIYSNETQSGKWNNVSPIANKLNHHTFYLCSIKDTLALLTVSVKIILTACDCDEHTVGCVCIGAWKGTEQSQIRWKKACFTAAVSWDLHRKEVLMGLEVLCMSILPTEQSLFNYDKVNSVLQTMTPLKYNHTPWKWKWQIGHES